MRPSVGHLCGVGRPLAQRDAFFRGFELSCFRDPLGDFAVREMKLKTDHEKEKVKLDRTRAKSGELG